MTFTPHGLKTNRQRTSCFPGDAGDAGASAAAKASIAKGYDPNTNNCAHTCRDALSGAGVQGMPEEGIGGLPLTPYQIFDAANAAGGRPPEE